MKIISFQDIIDCNQMLREKELAFQLHIRDACGKQSFWIEPVGNDGSEIQYEDLYHVLDAFLNKEDARFHLVKISLIFGWIERMFLHFYVIFGIMDEVNC